MPFSHLPALVSAWFAHSAAARDRRRRLRQKAEGQDCDSEPGNAKPRTHSSQEVVRPSLVIVQGHHSSRTVYPNELAKWRRKTNRLRFFA